MSQVYICLVSFTPFLHIYMYTLFLKHSQDLEESVSERERGRGAEMKGRERDVLSSSENSDTSELALAMREQGLEGVAAMSPTRGFPKTLSMKRVSSTPDLTSDVAGGDDGVAVGDEEIAVEDVEIGEKRVGVVSPELDEEERRKSAIDWERVSEGGAGLGQTTPTDMESRPSTSTPDIPTSPGSRLESTGDQEGSPERRAQVGLV